MAENALMGMKQREYVVPLVILAMYPTFYQRNPGI